MLFDKKTEYFANNGLPHNLYDSNTYKGHGDMFKQNYHLCGLSMATTEKA